MMMTMMMHSGPSQYGLSHQNSLLDISLSLCSIAHCATLMTLMTLMSRQMTDGVTRRIGLSWIRCWPHHTVVGIDSRG